MTNKLKKISFDLIVWFDLIWFIWFTVSPISTALVLGKNDLRLNKVIVVVIIIIIIIVIIIIIIIIINHYYYWRCSIII